MEGCFWMMKQEIACHLALGLIYLLVFTCCKSPVDPGIREIIEQEEIYPVIQLFAGDLSSLNYKEKTNLKWKVINASTVTIDNGIGPVATEGIKEIAPEETTTYILTATGDNGSRERSCVIICKPGYLKDNWGYPSIGSAGEYALYVAGKPTNKGWTTIYNPRATVSIYLSGELLAIKELRICDKVEPGETIIWEVIFSDPENYMKNNWGSLIPIVAYEWH